MCDEMGGEATDVSSDMAEPVDDIPEEAPDDIPEDIPDDIPEDISEESVDDGLSDVSEEIPEDIVEEPVEDTAEADEEILEDTETQSESADDNVEEPVDTPEEVPEETSDVDEPAEESPVETADDAIETEEATDEQSSEELAEEPVEETAETAEEIPEDTETQSESADDNVEEAVDTTEEVPEETSDADEATDEHPTEAAEEGVETEKPLDEHPSEELTEEPVEENAGIAEEIPEDKIDIQEKGLRDFFSNMFGGHNEVVNDAEQAEPTSDNKPLNRILNMDPSDLKESDKRILYSTARDTINRKYGDLVPSYKTDIIPDKIKVESTEECRKAYEASGDYYDENIVGFYIPSTDEIYVDAPRNKDMTEIMATVEHESLHLASSGGLCGRVSTKNGFSDSINGTNINEGFTELYAIRDMDDLGFNYKSSSYSNQVEVARELENVLGKDFMKEAYFTNNPEMVRNRFELLGANQDELKSIDSEGKIFTGKYSKFINALDEYSDVKYGDSDYNDARSKVYELLAQLRK